MNNELISHLRNVNKDSIIGLCIDHIVKKENELQELLDDLKTITREHPEIMNQILSKEAFQLLMQ
jgi:hypothetical protein